MHLTASRITNSLICFLLTLLSSSSCFSQSNPVAIDPRLSITNVMTVRNGAIRIKLDPISKQLFYCLTNGEVYCVLKPSAGPAYDSLVYTAVDHFVTYVQGMAFYDSTLYISGNDSSNTPLTTGLIVRGKLQPNGSRIWDTLAATQPYKTSDYFDHLFSGLALQPSGDSLLICSGARGDHGEIQTRYGLYPGIRNEPLTSRIFIIPAHDTVPIILMNDSAWLDTCPYNFANGIRNTFDMAYDAHGHLFGLENSGDRDHHEEMNWLLRGHHYGFPWKMGDTENPQQFPGFDPLADSLINHYTRTWRLGFWNNDPGFPPPPPGLVFDDPIRNFGPDCDKFRDSLTGRVYDASDSGISIATFTAHRSPLGLTFDTANVLHPDYRGDGFMLSWTRGYDSCGCTVVPDTGIGPFLDPSEDLVHLNLQFDSSAGNFSLHATRIIGSFQHPVDAVLDSNRMYVLENGYAGVSRIYQIGFPLAPACNPRLNLSGINPCSPASGIVTIDTFGILPYAIEWYDSLSNLIRRDTSMYQADTIQALTPGNYFARVWDSGVCSDSLAFSIPDSIRFDTIYSSGTSCIGCMNGIVHYSIFSEILLSNLTISPSTGTFGTDSIYALPAGDYIVCVEDIAGCLACDSVTVLEDPTQILRAPEYSSVLISPQPADDHFYIRTQLKARDEFTIHCFAFNGSLIYNESIKQFNKNNLFESVVSTENWPDGIYFIEVLSSTFSGYQKLVVMHR